jgi:hypothetical protein
VDDLYYLPLPPGLAAGEYTLALGVAPESEKGEEPRVLPIGKIDLARAVPAQPALPHPMQAHFTSPTDDYRATLRGYDVEVESKTKKAGKTEQNEAPYPVAEAGDTVVYNLYWQADQTVPPIYRVYFQLLSHDWQVLAQVNELLALYSQPLYALWNPFYIRSNQYRLEIPANSVGGLYRPQVWIYEPDRDEEFVIDAGELSPDGETLFLPPLKIARRADMVQPVIARFDDTIALVDYKVETPETGLQPNSTFTVTLTYQALAPTPQDQVQFVHLSNPAHGMAAQFDTPPQAGGNPTSTWVPGEVVTETITLTIDPQAQPGDYTLSLGFYDPLAGGARMSVFDAGQQLQPDNQFVLAEMVLE